MFNKAVLLFVLVVTTPFTSLYAEDPVRTSEIIVTADPLGTSLLALPSSVSVLGSERYEGTGSLSLQNSLELVPNLNWAGGSNRPRFFQIRGIGELEQYEGAPNHSVGLLIDDFDFSGIGSVANLFDSEQIEVLRGPQGLVYGTNALAGIVRIKTADPTPYQTGKGQFSIGSDDLINGGFAVGGPVTGTNEKIQFRVSAFHEEQNGFRKNQFLGRDDTNGRDEFTGRAKLKILPSDDVTIDLSLLRVDMQNGYDAFAIDNSFKTQSDRPGVDDQGSTATSAKVSWKLSDDEELSSTTSNTHSVINYSFDGDWGNNPFWAPYAPYDYFSRTFRRRNALSEEIRLTSVPQNYEIGRDYTWIGGVYAQRLTEDSEVENSQDGSAYDTLLGDFNSTSTAGFGQVELPLFNKTSLTSGLRVENRRGDFSDSRGSDFSPIDTMIGGNVSLNHALNDNTRVYGLVSRGFRGGGFNSGIQVPEGRKVFEPEYLWNFEAGIKNSLPEYRLKTSTALFYSERRDQQVKLSLQNDPNDPLSFTFLTDNAAKGRNVGAEFESSWQATGTLSVDSSLSLLATKFLDFEDDTGERIGREQSHAPTWQYSVGPRYQFTDQLFIKIGIAGKDSFYFDDSHNQRSSAYSTVNASLGYETENWTWTLWANNIFDKEYAVRGFFFGNEPPEFPAKEYVQLGDPFQIGTTMTFNF